MPYCAGIALCVDRPNWVGDNGLVRQYSLVDPAPAGARHYRIGVKVQPDGRGGSKSIAERVLEGGSITIGAPRNLFPLDTQTRRQVLLVAGGIGITPIHAMANELMATPGAVWQLHYAFSRREDAYFPSSWLQNDSRVSLYESDPSEGKGSMIDLQALVDQALGHASQHGGQGPGHAVALHQTQALQISRQCNAQRVGLAKGDVLAHETVGNPVGVLLERLLHQCH